MFKKKMFLLFMSLAFVISCAKKEKPVNEAVVETSEAVAQSDTAVEETKPNVAEKDFTEIDSPIYYVTDFLKLRKRQGTEAEEIRILQPNSCVKILEVGEEETIDGKSATWKKVQNENNDVGWCFSAYLEKEKPSYKILTYKEIKMLDVAGGTFKRPLKDGASKNISIDSFSMSAYEITVEQFRAFLKETNTEHVLNEVADVHIATQLEKCPNFVIPAYWPALYVDFFNACKFCNWLSEKEGLEPCYEFGTENPQKPHDTEVLWDKNKNGYRLPTEAEWEYVASQTDISDIKQVAVLQYDWRYLSAEVVGSKAPNALGFYDIIGNVAEWCWDLYAVDYYANCEENNPKGPDVGYNPTPFDPHHQGIPPSTTDRVVKGHSCLYRYDIQTEEISPYDRYFAAPAIQINPIHAICIGFRVVRNK
ncbi:MAG: SUMF1/EgtB/PvdO family nonheme iron enzyme [Treponemataceae bacterium]